MMETDQKMNNVVQDMEENVAEIYKIRGLDLILTSINCQQYKSLFESYGINEYTIVNMTDSDLKHMNVNEKDIATIMNAINVLNKSLSYHEVRFTNDDISKIQSNICGELGSIALIMNHIYYSIASNENHFNDVLIDNYLSSIDAALMLKPYMEAENKSIEKSLKKCFKLKQSKTTLLVTTTTVILFSIAFWRLNYSFNFISRYSNLMSKMKN